MTASERAAGELVADVDTLTGFLGNCRRHTLTARELAEALVAAGFGRIDAARREALVEVEGVIQSDLDAWGNGHSFATGLYRAAWLVQMHRNGTTS